MSMIHVIAEGVAFDVLVSRESAMSRLRELAAETGGTAVLAM